MLCRAIAKHLPRTCFTVVSFWIGRSVMKNLNLSSSNMRFLAYARNDSTMSFWRPQGGRISTQALAKHLYQMTRIRVYTRNLLQSVTIPAGYYHFGRQAGNASKKHFGMRKRFPSQNILFQTIWESLYKFGMVRLEKRSILCKRRKDPFSLKGPDSK